LDEFRPLACGLWPGARRLYAVIVDDGQLRLRPICAAQTREACECLLAWLVLSDRTTVVLSDRGHLLIAHARAACPNLELVPHPLLEAVRRVAGLEHRSPRYTAALLTRWHLTPLLRAHWRHSHITEQSASQLPLL